LADFNRARPLHANFHNAPSDNFALHDKYMIVA
jgi:hypothetical protein